MSAIAEFPKGADTWPEELSRRAFIKVMGASLALAGLSDCSWFPAAHALPYVRQPEEVVPGRPLFYATTFTYGGFALGTLAETHMARPTKLEGNPDHPSSLGGSDAFLQASLLDLYHPERGKTPTWRGATRSWDDFYTELIRLRIPAWESTRGRGLRILTGTVTSPALAAQIGKLLARYPEARWIAYDSCGRDRALGGARLAFGRPLAPVYHLDRARVIVSLGSDFLAHGPGRVRYARDYADARRVREPYPTDLPRLRAVDCGGSLTGANADSRLATRPSRMPALAQALAAELGVHATAPALSSEERQFVIEAATDLRAHRESALVLVGDDEPVALHALGFAMNETLTSRAVELIAPPEASPEGQLAALTRLAAEMHSGEIDALIALGIDPVATSPADLEFARALERVPFRVCHDTFARKTAFHSDWYLPQAHFLEDWGDARAHDGTISLVQPVIAPLYQGVSALALVAALGGKDFGVTPRQHLRLHWNSLSDEDWERALREGLLRGTQSPAVTASVRADSVRAALAALPAPAQSALEIRFEPDPRRGDGSFSQNPWLQELPRPLTHLTWDSAILLSPATAAKLGIADEDVAELEVDGRRIQAPVLTLVEHADDVVTAYLGDTVAEPLRTTRNFAYAPLTRVTRTGRRHELAVTRSHHEMDGHDFARTMPLSRLLAPTSPPKPLPDLYPGFASGDEAWAMVIDLNACIGCQVCAIACQAENNISVVGREQVRMGREMHWIRIDTYFTGSQTRFQPVPCMHCEEAPCEYVCPVMATVHDSSGINQMVYNRCVGTRDCSNNCPYKVRRFNFLQYSKLRDPLRRLAYNPDVTVRERGVMEKCTYCIQRISAARIAAGKENRRIRPGEVIPACAQACPTRAIDFGNLLNPDDPIRRLKAHPLRYDLLAEQGTKPRTSYLARVRPEETAT